jgi:PAS domain S-box-containing protein
MARLITNVGKGFDDPAGSTAPHVTTEHKLRTERDYAEIIVNTVREPMLVLTGDLRVASASRAFYETFGVSPEATVGQFLYDLGNGEWDISALRRLIEDVLPKHSEFRDFEVEHDFPSLGRRVMLLNGRTLWSQTNNTHRVLLAIEDVTERKRIQDNLITSNEDLQRFTYVLAHDLRSPLNASLRLLQLLTRQTKEKLNEEEASLLADSLESIERLSALTQDLLTWTDAGNAPQQRKLVPIGEPLQIALANLQHHVIEAGATIAVSEMPTLLADRTQLAMVFQNLIGNALKYRREENPHVRVDAVPQGTTWRFSVTDNGQGFKAQYASSIFEPFKRLHGVDVPGSGIGLATCKRTIERLGGKIWANSVLGQGSTFHFTLPA